MEQIEDKTALTAFLFNRMNVFNVNLIQQQNLIRQQQAQIQQLQQKLSQEVTTLKNVEQEQVFNEKDDTTLFEEPAKNTIEPVIEDTVPAVDETVEEKIKKTEETEIQKEEPVIENISEESGENTPEQENITEEKRVENIQQELEEHPINKISEGRILEKTLTPEQKNYNDSLDYLDGNVKYSKYVIYIDPQNVDFIEGLTVKERKNLINNILRSQDDIAMTKQRFKIIQTVIRHSVIAIITLAVSIPIIYYAINVSLEASINNYRRSQSNFQTLYRENGKITNSRR